MQRPDVLVLGAGGTIGAAWMGGVLAGIAAETGDRLRRLRARRRHLRRLDASPPTCSPGVEPRAPGPPRPRRHAPADAEDGGCRASRCSPARRAPPAPTARRPPAARAGRAARRRPRHRGAAPRSPRSRCRSGARRARSCARRRSRGWRSRSGTLDDLGARIARHGLRWDGRLRVVCVDRARGRRVVFGSPGAPAATVAEAVQASCSIPGFYRPVRIGESEYVDGAVWSPTNMDAAPAGRETHVLCLAPMGGPLGSRERHPGGARRHDRGDPPGDARAAAPRRARRPSSCPSRPAPPSTRASTGYRQGRALARESGSTSASCVERGERGG